MQYGRTLVMMGALGLVSAACGGPSGPEFTAADGEEVRSVSQRYVEAFNAMDAEALTALFSGAASFMPPNSSTVRGPESIRGYYETMWAEGEHQLESESSEMGGDGNLAFDSGTYILTSRMTVPVVEDPEAEEDPDAEPAEPAEPEVIESRDRGTYLVVLRKPAVGGSWMIEQLMWNSDLPLPAPPAPEPEAEEGS